MNSPFKYTIPLFPLLLLQVCALILICNAQRPQALTNQSSSSKSNHSISAFLVFGDSTVDPGNNNYLEFTVFKSNFPPYGRDFLNHIPTGRFTNGRLVTDFAASYVGVKEYIPPYLDPTLSIEELRTGVSFASAGSGYDPLTATITGVNSVEKQMEYFREYKKRLEDAIGKERTKIVIKKAMFVVSAGTNDLVLYFAEPIHRQSYSVAGYQHFLIQIIQHFIQDLVKEGARKIGIVGIPPIGCLPVVITLYSQDSFYLHKCIETLSSVSRDYNQMLQTKLKDMQYSDVKIFYADIYKPISDIIQSPKKFGFDEVYKGCCGTGYIETAGLCNPKSTVCYDASKYVFWDSMHPTERAYYILFESLRSTIDLVLEE